MAQGDGRTLTWSSFNKPVLITRNGNQTAFNYGPDRARYKQVATAGNKTTITTYTGSIYEQRQILENSTTTYENIHYIQAGGQVIASFTTFGNGPNLTTFTDEDTEGTLLYLHRDHQGSVDAITDVGGYVVDRLSFDAFGTRRMADWNTVIGQLVLNTNVTRGYTGHEHLDGVDLIHMNGRVYDAKLGRFLSADPFVQQPQNLQSLNRYSYVVNNPLTNVDPSGFILGKLFGGIGKLFKAVTSAISSVLQNPYVRLALGIAAGFGAAALVNSAVNAANAAVIAASAGPVAVAGAGVSAATGAVLAGAAGGFAGGLVASGGDLRSAIIGGITGGAAGFIGSSRAFGAVGRITARRVAAHGIVGGARAEAQGGSFKSGFVSSAFTKSVSNVIERAADANPLAGGVAAAVVGGTASRLTGGKFQNAALTTAFQYLYNQAMTAGERFAENYRRSYGFGAKVRGFFSGVGTIFKGGYRSIRFVGRGTGLLGQEEYDDFTREAEIVDKAAEVLYKSDAVRAEIGVRVISAGQNIHFTDYDIAKVTGRALTGAILSPLGVLATIGDVTNAVEVGVETGNERLLESAVEGFIFGDY